jgi:hypothetical protein
METKDKAKPRPRGMRQQGVVIPGVLLSAIDLGVHGSACFSRIEFKFMPAQLGFLFWIAKNRNRLRRPTSLFPSRHSELSRKATHSCLEFLARTDRQEFTRLCCETKQCEGNFQRASGLGLGTKAGRRQDSRCTDGRLFAQTET